MRGLRFVALMMVPAMVAVLASGCTFTFNAGRYAAAPGTVSEPFWCAPEGGVVLSTSDCTALSVQLDKATAFAHQRLHASTALAQGAVASPYVVAVGAAFRFHGPTSTFDPGAPDTLLYDGTDGAAQVAAVEWNVASASAPAGFIGPNDEWMDVGGGVWRLRAWTLRPFQHMPNVFADAHPCLAAAGPIYSLTDDCYTDTHTRPLEILVSNDDGYNAEGIDAVVEALRDLPNVHVTVSAPATNQSGSGGSTTPGGVTATLQQTLSGYPAWAANGFPADSVLYALNTLHSNPDLLVSGSNNGQNIGPFISISGTVGAARVGGRGAIPSVAVSQGFAVNGIPPDFPSSVNALMTWINGFLFGREGPARFQSVVNINAPTCASGSIRGTVEVPAATALNGRPFNPSNCESTETSFADDIDAFINGYVTISSIGT